MKGIKVMSTQDLIDAARYMSEGQQSRLFRDVMLYGSGAVFVQWDEHGNPSLTPVPVENVILDQGGTLEKRKGPPFPPYGISIDLGTDDELGLTSLEDGVMTVWSNGGPSMYNDSNDPLDLLQTAIAKEERVVDAAMQRIKQARNQINLAETDIVEAEKRKRVLQDAIDKLKR